MSLDTLAPTAVRSPFAPILPPRPSIPSRPTTVVHRVTIQPHTHGHGSSPRWHRDPSRSLCRNFPARKKGGAKVPSPIKARARANPALSATLRVALRNRHGARERDVVRLAVLRGGPPRLRRAVLRVEVVVVVRFGRRRLVGRLLGPLARGRGRGRRAAGRARPARRLAGDVPVRVAGRGVEAAELARGGGARPSADWRARSPTTGASGAAASA